MIQPVIAISIVHAGAYQPSVIVVLATPTSMEREGSDVTYPTRMI